MAESKQKPKQDDAVDSEVPHAKVAQAGKPQIWYCPSRWLLAHNDTQANIFTQSSHMCLADLFNDGENLLALVDFKDAAPPAESAAKLTPGSQPPYTCRLRVYRGQQLIYNHFLDDIPSSLIVTTISVPLVSRTTAARSKLGGSGGPPSKLIAEITKQQTGDIQLPMLLVAINEDLYFYYKLRPSHQLCLEDNEFILDSLNKSEVDAWEMARKGQIEDATMRELLMGLSQELGNHALTSHSNNFIALASSDERKQYLVNWKLKRLASSGKSGGEQLMSMDSVCCAAARLSYNSTLTISGDYGHTRERTTILNKSKWDLIMDSERDGLILGTEDRHLLIYELGLVGSRIVGHGRLPAVPDHILVERRSPASFNLTLTNKKFDSRELTYKILVSCRDCKIYSLDQPYLVREDQEGVKIGMRELVALKSNVLDMCWTGMNESRDRGGNSCSAKAEPNHRPTFLVACLDRRFYCFSSHSGQCKWVTELELPITCMVCLPKLTIGCDEASLVGVASQANRFDFYVASTGRIVDSIYFQDDFPVAAKFGRFGREDNCLCLTTQRGHLMVFILKRTAKFAHGQCLSSAASYASDTLASCSQILKQRSVLGNNSRETAAASAAAAQTGARHTGAETHAMNLHEQANLPSAFVLSKTNSAHATNKILDSLISSHDCDQVTAKNALDAHAPRSQLQIPMKDRDFVDQIVDQSRQSRQSGRLFAKQMVSLRDKVRTALGQHQKTGSFDSDESNRVSLVKIVGLGGIYRVNMTLRLSVAKLVSRYQEFLDGVDLHNSTPWQLTCYIEPKNDVQNRSCQVHPFRVELPVEADTRADLGIKSILEAPIIFKLSIRGQNFEALDGDCLSIEVKVIASHCGPLGIRTIQRPLYLATTNIPLTC